MAKLQKHQKLMLDPMIEGYKQFPECRFMYVDYAPPASGKTFLFPHLYKKIKQLDPKVKFIIETPQKQLALSIAGSFKSVKGARTLHIRGIEDQVSELLADMERFEAAKKDCAAYIMKAFGGGAEGKSGEEKKNEFILAMERTACNARAIEFITGPFCGTGLSKDTEDDILKKQQAGLRSSYTKAEKILENAVWKAAERNAKLICGEADGEEGPSKEELEEAKEKEYVKQLEYLPENAIWLFPDMAYELSDVIILTYARANRSILIKRRMKLSELCGNKEGEHIVLIMDEAEVGRDIYIKTAIEQGVNNEIDVLPFLNRISGALNENIFDNEEYADSKGENSARKAAEALKKELQEFCGKFGYVPGMHMGDPDGTGRLPAVVNCMDYTVGKDVHLRYISTDKKMKSITLAETGVDEKRLETFVHEAKKIIRHFINCVHLAAKALNNTRSLKGSPEEYSESAESVVYRIFGDNNTPAARYTINNTYGQHGAARGYRKKRHVYRSEIAYTSVRGGSRYGRDATLRCASVPGFPESNLENIIANVRFVYLFSGTGWLNAINNYDVEYLSGRHGRYIPKKEKIAEIHDAYIEWKGRQYGVPGTEFDIERVSGKWTEDYRKNDIDIICTFIDRHIRKLNEHGINGSSGAFIFPPRKLDDSPEMILSGLRKKGVDTDRVVLLTLEKGEVQKLGGCGKGRKLPEGMYRVEGDTVYINTEDGRYYYVVTAHRSGTRGYNIAFRKGNRGEPEDASGACIFELTNIIPSMPGEGENRIPAAADIMEDTGRILGTNMAYLHCMMLRDGEISREMMKNAMKQIRGVSYTPYPVRKDIYQADMFSPYKLQGTSEILQAIGRIRNNKKPPLVYVCISTGVFAKQMLRTETLRPECLSYEAEKVYAALPRLWSEYWEEIGKTEPSPSSAEPAGAGTGE